MNTDFTLENVNKILGIKESFKAPDKLMELLFDSEKRIEMFQKFLDISTDMSFDWFHQYFQEEQAERKTNKQDFTPNSVAEIMSRLTADKRSNSYYEVAAGTGGILITKWFDDCLKETPLTYMPHEHEYHVEELSDRALPFLLFNIAIRGMNATVFHGDSLERTCRGIFFIQNTKDDVLGFSDINVMPRSKAVKQEFNIKKWIGEPYPDHIESDSKQWAINVEKNMVFKRKLGDIFDRSSNQAG
ncbi:N-6 DNA methylase [Paucilactobacillus sp. N302-9]